MAEEEPMKMEINELPANCGYELIDPEKNPIPVEITQGVEGDSPYLASAGLGLLVPGAGDTPEEARDDLAVIIVDQADKFKTDKAQARELFGVAEFCDTQIAKYIRPTG